MALLNSFVDQLRRTNELTPEHHRHRNLHWPPPPGSSPPNENDRHAAAIHVSQALRQWGNRFEIPPGDIHVLMSTLQTLQAITSLDPSTIHSLPIEDRTKTILRAFFGNNSSSNSKPPSLCQDPPMPSAWNAGHPEPQAMEYYGRSGMEETQISFHVTQEYTTTDDDAPPIPRPPSWMQDRSLRPFSGGSVHSTMSGLRPPPAIQRTPQVMPTTHPSSFDYRQSF